MRVLWFINIPTQEAAKYLGYNLHNIGGWIESLKNEFVKKNNITLGIAFVAGDNKYKNFIFNSITYYKLPYLRPTKGIKGRIANLTHKLESLEVVDYCLRAVEDFKPDIIHIFGTERNYGLMINKVKMPCIVHIQGILNEIIKNYFKGISPIDIIKYGYSHRLISGSSILHYYFQLKRQAKRELEIFKQCKYFLGRTNWDHEMVFKYSNGAHYYHCDEILRNEFYDYEWNYTNKIKKNVYSTISPVNYKGLETIAECGILLNKEKGLNIDFRIGGVSSRDEVYKIILGKYGNDLQNYIKPLGNITERDIIKEMLSADVFVHPSHIDNSPNSVCEAMILGMPVVSTDVGGIPSLIENEIDGILIPSGNANRMADAILRIMNDKLFSNKLSKNARKRALERHNKEKIMKKIFEIYNNLINYT